MKLLYFVLVCLPAVMAVEFVSMSMKDVGISKDIHRIASSLNDIFKESFELMVGSLGKHGVYYLPEIKHQYHLKLSEETKQVEFQASNGWMKNPMLKTSKDMVSGAFRKYKVPVTSTAREVLLVCVECMEIAAQAVNYCYEANFGNKNVSGTITTGPIIYKFSVQIRISQSLKNNLNNSLKPSCNVTVGEKSFELTKESDLHGEVRGLRTLNFLADNIDELLKSHFNSTVKNQMEKRFLTSLNKTITKHDICEEFVG